MPVSVQLPDVTAHDEALILHTNTHTHTHTMYAHLDKLLEQDESGLHDSRIRITEGPPEVLFQVGDKVWVECQEVVHHHHGFLANQLPVRVCEM